MDLPSVYDKYLPRSRYRKSGSTSTTPSTSIGFTALQGIPITISTLQYFVYSHNISFYSIYFCFSASLISFMNLYRCIRINQSSTTPSTSIGSTAPQGFPIIILIFYSYNILFYSVYSHNILVCSFYFVSLHSIHLISRLVVFWWVWWTYPDTSGNVSQQRRPRYSISRVRSLDERIHGTTSLGPRRYRISRQQFYFHMIWSLIHFNIFIFHFLII